EITPEIITRAVLKNPEGFAEAVRAALLAKPEIFAEAAQAYQAKQERDAQAAILPKIKQFEDELFNSDSPFIGNPNGSKVVVEFLDYQCGYCRAAHEPSKQMVKADGDLKVILKDLPVLGPLSGVAARAAGAAKLQGKYVEFHNALME